MRVLIPGHKGMLGHMVHKYFLDNKVDCVTLLDKFPSPEFTDSVIKFNGDFIVNCIGNIPQRTNHFNINFELPIWLERSTNIPIIHPGTDCEMDSDDYGISKLKARDFIVNTGTHTKIIKTSIIGPELQSNFSLMNWFLSTKDTEVNGYTQSMWNGNTTLEWAKECYMMLYNFPTYPIETILEGKCVSKFELLNYINDIFDKQIKINPKDVGLINKCLVGNRKTSHIETQLMELKQYYYGM